MKRNLMIGLAVVIIVIIVVVAGILAFGTGNKGDNNGGLKMPQVATWSGQYQIGEFVEYYANQSVSVSGGYVLGHSILNETATEITQGLVTVHGYQNFSDYPSNNVNGSWNYPTNASFAFNKGDNYNYHPADIALFKYDGNETLMTKWGSIVCQHFELIDTSGSTNDCWAHNGIIVRNVVTMEGYYMEYVLKNTNLTEINGP